MNAKSLLRSLTLASLMLGTPLTIRAHNGVVHGDHDAHHGGFVMMYRDLHCEVVVRPQGIVQLYLTDASRADLPASVVTDVSVEIERKGIRVEAVRMAISAGGDFWEGKSMPVAAKDTTVHAAFVFGRESVVVNLPASSVMGGSLKKPAPAAPPKLKGGSAPLAAKEHRGH